MTIDSATWQQVRQRAQFSCEFCTVSETDAGGELTTDHFRPRSKGGASDVENLIYCCFRCNLYKQDYWPSTPEAPELWNPRQDPASLHFLNLDTGCQFHSPMWARLRFEDSV
jgi:5-methylcytosine-specific restriction endonuclease McrA